MVLAAKKHGLEGVVAKRDESTYRPGRRDRNWIKTLLRHRPKVIICGWTPGQGRRAGSISSLLLGNYSTEAGEPVYIGSVGTGFTEQMLSDLRLGQPPPGHQAHLPAARNGDL